MFKKKESSRLFASYEYKHLDSCPRKGKRFESEESVPRPVQGDPAYAEDWDQDPDYEGDSGTEAWE